MERQQFTSMAHAKMAVWNPVSVERIQSYLQMMQLPPGAQVLDIGCGRGYVLGLVLSQSDVVATGVEPSPYATQTALQELAPFLESGRLTLIQENFNEEDFESQSFDVVVCLGATHAIKDFAKTLDVARRLLRPNGYLLIGEGCWKQDPIDEYLEYLGVSSDFLFTHEIYQTLGKAFGFELVAGSESSLEEWDAFEDAYVTNVENYVRDHPGDPEAEKLKRRIKVWHAMYISIGRDTLGFALYLFRKPAEGE